MASLLADNASVAVALWLTTPVWMTAISGGAAAFPCPVTDMVCVNLSRPASAGVTIKSIAARNKPIFSRAIKDLLSKIRDGIDSVIRSTAAYKGFI
jgi:hypothetical protein